MSNEVSIISSNELQSMIFTIRGLQVMLDSDLAEMYKVETKYLTRAVSRNIQRFPEQFRFQLTQEELENLKCRIGTSSSESLRFQNGTLEKGRGKHRKYLPYVFTEQGVSMLSAVLRSKTAIKVSVQIMDAFVGMRKFIANNAAIFQRLDSIEQKQYLTDTKLDKVFEAIEARDIKPVQGIFFDGQVFDAYLFVADLIKSAKKSIVLIDNYVDESTLMLLAKRKNGCTATIYTNKQSEQLKQDLQKHNEQYPPIEIKTFKHSHDRFLILDGATIYHVGASLKDVGKKWFAFSKMDKSALAMLEKLSHE